MQGTRVPALVWEDPTCCGAAKPVRHNYWACALEPASHNYWAHGLEPVLRSKRSHRNEKPGQGNKSNPLSPQLERARAQQQRCNGAKNKNKLINQLILKKTYKGGTSLVVRCVRLRAPNAGGPGSIPGQGTRSQHACCNWEVHVPQLRHSTA